MNYTLARIVTLIFCCAFVMIGVAIICVAMFSRGRVDAVSMIMGFMFIGVSSFSVQ